MRRWEACDSMKRSRGAIFLLSIFAVLFLYLTILSCAARGMIFYKQSASQKSVLRGVESIDAAVDVITKDFSDIVSKSVVAKYEAFTEIAEDDSLSPLKESELDNYFRMGVLSDFEDTVGKGDELFDYIESIIPKPTSGTLYIDPECKPYLKVDTSSEGNILSAFVKNVTLVYKGIPGITRKETIDFEIVFPEAIFYAGNEDIFNYCMMAGKGIYISGDTSSLVGDIFAGSHQAVESRDAEIAYGEIGAYGGLNFLSTQVGIQSDNIVSKADINLNGSFVIFNPNESGNVNCFAGKIRKIRGYSSDSMYSMAGDYKNTEELSADDFSLYKKYCDLADETLAGVGEIPFYYDSNNDSRYSGEYRKIISTEDIEISEDITGIVFTPGNVIINAGCNVEGLILAGDRIYALGNNSIVSNAKIVKKIISDEIDEMALYEKENNNDEIVLNDDGTVDSGVIYHALDYMGGLVYPGLLEQDYYVIPYQE